MATEQTVPELLRPHLAIYLDVPADVVMQKVKDRNLPNEVDSPFMKPEIIAYMEQIYKLDYLKKLR